MKNRPGKKHRAPSPYKKRQKVAASYATTPLNKKGEGTEVTDANVERFLRRLGVA